MGGGGDGGNMADVGCHCPGFVDCGGKVVNEERSVKFPL